MPWTNAQKALANIARRELRWENPQYRLVLQNVAGIRSYCGSVSSTNPSADNAGFERFMAFCETCGFVDSKNGQGYWTRMAAKQRQRIIYKIVEVADRGRRSKLISADGLPGYVERMTAKRPLEQGGPTRELENCDAIDLFKILEGLKKWISRLEREHNVALRA